MRARCRQRTEPDTRRSSSCCFRASLAFLSSASLARFASISARLRSDMVVVARCGLVALRTRYCCFQLDLHSRLFAQFGRLTRDWG